MSKPTTPTLEQRIATALSSTDMAATDVAELLRETATAMAAADETTVLERAKALDPLISPDPVAAREAMQAAEFARDRLRTLFPRLIEHHAQVKAAEDLQAWRAELEELQPLHEQLVNEFMARYPKLSNELATLMQRITEVDRMVQEVQVRQPPNAPLHLERIEVAARGRLEQPEISVLAELRLPRYPRMHGEELYLWPLTPKIDWSHPMFQPRYDPAYTADWQQVREQRAQRQREEQERIAAEERERQAAAAHPSLIMRGAE